MNTLRITDRDGVHVRYVIENEKGVQVGAGDGDFPAEIQEASDRHIALSKVLAEKLEAQPAQEGEEPAAVSPGPSRYTELYPDVPEHSADHAGEYVTPAEMLPHVNSLRQEAQESQRRHSVTDGRLSALEALLEGVNARLEVIPSVDYLRSLFALLYHGHDDLEETLLRVQGSNAKLLLDISKINGRLSVTVTRQEVDQLMLKVSEVLEQVPLLLQKLELLASTVKVLEDAQAGPVKGHHHKIGKHDHTMADIADLPEMEAKREEAESLHVHRFTKHTAEGMRCAVCDELKGPAATSGVTEEGEIG